MLTRCGLISCLSTNALLRMAWIDACESVWMVRLQSILVVSDVKCLLLFSQSLQIIPICVCLRARLVKLDPLTTRNLEVQVFSKLWVLWLAIAFCRMGTDSLFCQKCVTGTLPVGRRKRYSLPVLMMSDRTVLTLSQRYFCAVYNALCIQ